MTIEYLNSAIKQFEYYKLLGEKTMAQISEQGLFWQYNPESNSIAIIVKHLRGNMLSRWTDFLNSDGEKEWRNRDSEFETDLKSRDEVMQYWNEGWSCLLTTLQSLQESDFDKIVFIRNQGHSVVEAINRQLAHYAYHVGQIVFIGKMICNDNWISLSIPKGASQQYNGEKFSQEKHREHFTNEFLEDRK
ncbi:MAG: DUF1572 domain-containing protein [Sphingobacteriales bacterium]|nr:MAG: DUF1572 domain-containing protein [Sphingobacteriales bacterium]